MKFFKYVTVIAVLTFSFPSKACDICGCSTGGSYLGILPQFQRNLAGLRFQYRNFMHPNTELNMNGESQVLEDRFYTTEAWMRFYPSDRIQLFIHVPYTLNQRFETMRTTTIEGIGDIRLTANYSLINTGDSILRNWKNLLLIGGGIKLPTGKYQQRDETRLMLPASFQVGTGAYSLLFNVIHTLRYKSWGINTTLQYSMNGRNEISYDYGDQYSAAFSLFYWKGTRSGSFLPNAGISYEYSNKDYQYDVIKPYSGGSVTLFNAGLDIYLNRFLINTFVQVPVSHNIPSSQPAGQLRLGGGISFFFGADKSSGWDKEM